MVTNENAVITGKVKFPSDRLFKDGTRRKVLFSTASGDVIVWGESHELDPNTVRKGMAAQIEITGTDQRSGKYLGRIVSFGANGHQQPVNGNPGQYPPGAPPQNGYPQHGPAIADQGQQGNTPNSPDITELGERADIYRRMYVHIWNEMINDEKMPQVSDDVRQKCVATIFIQACKGL